MYIDNITDIMRDSPKDLKLVGEGYTDAVENT